MKYPQKQFNKLVTILKKLSNYFDIQNMNSNQLHYLAYQQVSEGQPHNAFIVLDNNTLVRQFELDKNDTSVNRLFKTDTSFELYPNDTEDSHIETAVKRALKKINNKNT